LNLLYLFSNRKSWAKQSKIQLKRIVPFLFSQSGTDLKRILSNTNWLLFEKIFRMGLGLFVGVWVARYLGPRQYGILSYASSVVAFLGVFVYLGLSGIVVRDIIKYREEKELLLGTTFVLKTIGGIIGYIIIIMLALIMHKNDSTEFWVLVIIGAGLVFSSFDVIHLWFHSQIQAKYVVYATSCSLILASVLKIILIVIGAPVVAFACVALIAVIATSIVSVYMYKYKVGSLFYWRAKLSKAKELLSQSWLLIFSHFFVIVYLKIDQIMLEWIVGPKEVGIYSVAVILSESWYFVPTAIVASVFPKLVEQKSKSEVTYNKNLQKIYDVLFFLALSLALLITFFSHTIISILYGGAYEKAAAILMVHIWAGVFIFMRQLFSRWLIVEGLLKYSLYTHGLGAILNVVINLILIKPYGGLGAAVATLISYAGASYFILFFYKNTRSAAKMMSLSMALPFRLIMHKGKVWQ